MSLSSTNVESVQFGTTRKRGYDRAEVHRFLARVAKTLQGLESELAVSLRLNHECEDRLEKAIHDAEDSSTSFVLAADLKQRLLADAEARALEIIHGAHEEAATSDIEAAASADLEVLMEHMESEETAEIRDDRSATSVDEGADAEPRGLLQSDPAAAVAASHESEARADVEAERVEDAAVIHATRGTLEQAERALTAARDEAGSILDAAREEADRVQREGTSAAETLVESATRDAAELVSAAEGDIAKQKRDAAAESTKMLRSARLRAEGVLESAQVRHQEALTRLRELEEQIAEVERVAPRLETADPDEPDIAVLLDESNALSHELATDLLLQDEELAANVSVKESRYSRRSAGLPSLGKEANDVLAGMDSLRKSEPERR